MSPTRTIYKHGKLLITAEYAVLDGALSLALPTKLGQRFEFSPIDKPEISWQSVDYKGQVWFEDRLELKHFSSALNSKTAQTLADLFTTIDHLNPKAFTHGWAIKATLEFDRNWGLGSSSTLVSALADFFAIDPYVLLDNSFGGSGYDIACADAEGPILYRNDSNGPTVKTVHFNPSFSDELYLVYLNQKMNSREAIRHYNAQPKSPELIAQVSTLTQDLITADNLEAFEAVVDAHERLIGQQLGIQPIGQTLFAGLPGVFSSLGAWGGDFALFSRKKNIPSLKEKVYLTILGLAELCRLS